MYAMASYMPRRLCLNYGAAGTVIEEKRTGTEEEPVRVPWANARVLLWADAPTIT